MFGLSATAYAWIKALHIISVIAWMAAMLYLPRLFVYHADAEPGSQVSEALKVMEKRLLYFILNPAATAAILEAQSQLTAQRTEDADKAMEIILPGQAEAEQPGFSFLV